MNKYRESLDYITSSVCENCDCNSDVGCTGCDVLKSQQVLKELIEKQTPKKPNLEGDGYDDKGQLMYDTWICPNCEEHYELDYEEYDYCPHCGQRIDWSDEK